MNRFSCRPGRWPGSTGRRPVLHQKKHRACGSFLLLEKLFRDIEILLRTWKVGADPQRALEKIARLLQPTEIAEEGAVVRESVSIPTIKPGTGFVVYAA